MAQRLARLPLLRWGALVVLLSLLIGLFPASQAQTDVRYFPETGHYLRGLFRAFWENNGGVEIFGFPITEEYIAPEDGRIKQYFERARFELAVNQTGQASVELGRLGVEITEGRVFPKVPPIENTAQRRYIPETQHIIQYGFKEIWETRGGERIFGFPISEEIQEILDDGEWHTVQYFERVRFEYWPDRAPGQRVLISNLGRRLAPPELVAPLPPNAPPSGPVGAPSQPGQPEQPAPPAPPAPPDLPPIPPSVNARVTPESGPPGTTFTFAAEGFEPGEAVGIWLTAPDQSTFGADFQATADSNGSIAGENIAITTNQEFADGIWSFNAQGVRSGRQAIGYFRISRVVGIIGDPNKLGIVAHDELSVQGDTVILPVAAPSGAPFEMIGAGYEPGEEVSSWITAPDETSTPLDEAAISREEDVAQISFVSAGFGNGIYTVAAQGLRSDVLNAAAFKITNDYVAGPGTPRPPSVNGSATPTEGGVGTVFQIRGQNLQPNEEIELWVTDPTGAYVLFPGTGFADGQGRVGYDPQLDLQATADLVPGVYGIHFRGRSSGVRVSIYFTYVSSAAQGIAAPDAGLHLMDRIVANGTLPASPRWQR